MIALKEKQTKESLPPLGRFSFFDLIGIFYYPVSEIATGLFVFREILTL